METFFYLLEKKGLLSVGYTDLSPLTLFPFLRTPDRNTPGYRTPVVEPKQDLRYPSITSHNLSSF